MKKLTLILTMLCTSWLLGFAQQSRISGKVTSSEGEAPAEGVSVLVKGTKKGTRTNSAGEFTINASTGQTIVLSGIGFASKEVVVNGNQLDITLTSTSSSLNEIVVV